MSIFDKPETKDREITFTIPKKVDPYFVDYYQKEKNDNETPGDFVLRKLGAIVAIDYVQDKVIADKQVFDDGAKQSEKAFQDGVKISRNDLSTFLIENKLANNE